MFDVARARQETPGCTHVLHFNNAGAALMPQPVFDAVTAHWTSELTIGGYEAADRAADAIEHVYEAIGELIGCAREEIALVENATRAWDMAFYAIDFRPGDRILTSVAEYASNYIAYLHMARRTGAVVEAVPNDRSGQVSVAALRTLIDDRVRLIAITHVPTNGGLVNPAAEIGAVAREAGVLFLLDACQSVGQLPLDVGQIGCDLLAATGRKYLRGPRGTGFLYVRDSVLEQLDPPLLDIRAATWVAKDRYELRKDARRFESWEGNVAAKIGLGVAVDYALQWGLETIWTRIQHLGTALRSQLETIPGVTVHDLGQTRCGIVTFTVDGHEPVAICEQLAVQGINVSFATVASTRLDMEARNLDSVVRASVHYYNAEAEIERFCAAVSAITRSNR